MYVCMSVCMCIYVCMYVCTCVRTYVCMYVCMYVCTYVVCMYICIIDMQGRVLITAQEALEPIPSETLKDEKSRQLAQGVHISFSVP